QNFRGRPLALGGAALAVSFRQTFNRRQESSAVCVEQCECVRVHGGIRHLAASVAPRSDVRETEQPQRVVLQNQRTNLVSNRDLFEVGQPAIRRDQGIVRAEEHLVLQQRVRILDQRRRKVLG